LLFWHFFSHSKAQFKTRNTACESGSDEELLEILGDPAHEVRNAGIHARVLPLAASDTPTHDADLHPTALVDHQWSSTVPLYKLKHDVQGN